MRRAAALVLGFGLVLAAERARALPKESTEPQKVRDGESQNDKQSGKQTGDPAPSALGPAPSIARPKSETTNDGDLPITSRIYLIKVHPSWVPVPSTQAPQPTPNPPATAVGPGNPAGAGDVVGSATPVQPATSATMPPPASGVPDRKVTLTVVNSDGQMSETLLPMPPVDDSLIGSAK